MDSVGALKGHPPVLNVHLSGRIYRNDGAPHGIPRTEGDDVMTLKLSDTMHDADFVVIDGVVFETEYVRIPDEFTVADDVVLEARHGETELAFTQGDFEEAQHVADGFYRLANGHLVRFLTSATIH
jgi:hypothetical protein